MSANKEKILLIASEDETDSSDEVYVFKAKRKWPMVDNEDPDLIELCKKRKVRDNGVEANAPNVSGDDSGKLENQLNLQIAEVSSGEEATEHFQRGDQVLCELKNVPSEYSEINVHKSAECNTEDVAVKLDLPSSPPIVVTEESARNAGVPVIDLTNGTVSKTLTIDGAAVDVIDLSEGPINDASSVVDLTHDDQTQGKKKDSRTVVSQEVTESESDNELPDIPQNQMMDSKAAAEFQYWLGKFRSEITSISFIFTIFQIHLLLLDFCNYLTLECFLSSRFFK